MKETATRLFHGYGEHPSRRTCMLMVTHACNLNCTYCYEKYKSDENMSLDTAKSIILQELDLVGRSRDFSELEVDFMGGEPMMNFPLIRDVVEWAEQEKFDIPIVFFLNSNGTLFDTSRKEWFRKHKRNIVVGLSYDGTISMQRCNRIGPSGIDVDFFTSTWPFQPLKMTISKDTLPHMAEGIISLREKNFLVDPSLAQGVEWNSTDAEILETELTKLKRFYLSHDEISPDSMMGLPFKGLGITHTQERKNCGSGKYIVTYDIDGRKYPCHMFTPLVMGDKAIRLEDCDFDSKGYYRGTACEKCEWFGWCSTCYGFNYKDRDNIHSRDLSWCIMVPVMAKVIAEFQIEYYHKHIDRIGGADMEHLSAAIRCMQLVNRLSKDRQGDDPGKSPK